MLYFESIQIDEHILDKIESKHGASFADACEACYSDEAHIRRGQEGLYKIFSRTEAGRYLLGVCRTTAVAPGGWSPRAR